MSEKHKAAKNTTKRGRLSTMDIIWMWFRLSKHWLPPPVSLLSAKKKNRKHFKRMDDWTKHCQTSPSHQRNSFIIDGQTLKNEWITESFFFGQHFIIALQSCNTKNQTFYFEINWEMFCYHPPDVLPPRQTAGGKRLYLLLLMFSNLLMMSVLLLAKQQQRVQCQINVTPLPCKKEDTIINSGLCFGNNNEKKQKL